MKKNHKLRNCICVVILTLAVTVTGCGSNMISEAELAARDAKLAEAASAIEYEKLSDRVPYKISMETLMSEATSETDNAKDSPSVGAKAVGAAGTAGVSRPTSDDFNWVWDIGNLWDVPKGATVLNTPDQLAGGWKVLLVGAEENSSLYTFSMLNAVISKKNKDNVTFTADWYRSALVDKNSGESVTFDCEKDRDTVYSGSVMDGHMYVYDTNSDPMMQYMYINGSMIYDFLVVNWYQYGSSQYGLGSFFTMDGKTIGNVYLTRTMSKYAGKLKTPDSPPEWAYFEGYWVYEHDDPENMWNDECYSWYVIPRTANSAYVSMHDEEWGASSGEICGVSYDPVNRCLDLKIGNDEYLATFTAVTYDGQDAIYVEYPGRETLLAVRTDESVHAQIWWDDIIENHIEYEKNEYDGIW